MIKRLKAVASLDTTDIIRFFLEQQQVTEKELQYFADANNTDILTVQLTVNRLLHSLLKMVGRHNGAPDSEFDPEELALGIKDEQEHTDDKDLAELIAKDHLSKNPRYYSAMRDAGIDDDEDDEDASPLVPNHTSASYDDDVEWDTSDD